MSIRKVLKSKIHGAVVTEVNLDYEGSITIDEALMREAGLVEHEKVLVGNITNGNRFETYVIKGEEGSGTIGINGAAAHLCNVGDKIIVMSFCYVDDISLLLHRARVVKVNERNEITSKTHNYIFNFYFSFPLLATLITTLALFTFLLILVLAKLSGLT